MHQDVIHFLFAMSLSFCSQFRSRVLTLNIHICSFSSNSSRFSARPKFLVPKLQLLPCRQISKLRYPQRTTGKKYKIRPEMDTTLSPTTPGLIPDDLLALISERKKFKERSHDTFYAVHKPGLEAVPTIAASSEPTSPDPPTGDPPKFVFDVIFIGDSMLERLKTTGVNTKLHNLPRSFNLGVGGDKIENVLYRLHLGYIDLLKDRPTKLWVLHIGSNNFTPKRGLRDVEFSNYRLLLQTLLLLSPESKILVTGIFNRKDISDEIVADANKGIKALVNELNDGREEGSEARLVLAEPTEAVTLDVLDDHVHLNKEGYQIWDEDVYDKVMALLK
ncbi:hypothetical protein ABW19_dt0208320 [Dactylella cylindrospora]|nr:hypothetical protein ABW19_dt0208320 [Dactylella cylindrospora]